MPKRVDPEEERALILDRCFPLFVEQGYGGVRMRALAEAAGVSTGKLYHYFPDKQSLMQRLFLHVGGRDVAAAHGMLTGGEGVAERLRLLADFVASHGPHLADTLVLALDHHRLEPGENATRDALRLYREALTESVGVDDEVLFSVLLGMLIRRVLDPDGVDLDAHRRWVEGLG
jgi:AcrR family transcriptional regulator